MWLWRSRQERRNRQSPTKEKKKIMKPRKKNKLLSCRQFNRGRSSPFDWVRGTPRSQPTKSFLECVLGLAAVARAAWYTHTHTHTSVYSYIAYTHTHILHTFDRPIPRLPSSIYLSNAKYFGISLIKCFFARKDGLLILNLCIFIKKQMGNPASHQIFQG